eukprot:1756981-Alexandrium_andersonii.AAC.1
MHRSCIIHESFTHRSFPAAAPWCLAKPTWDGSGRARSPKCAPSRLVSHSQWNQMAAFVA